MKIILIDNYFGSFYFFRADSSDEGNNKARRMFCLSIICVQCLKSSRQRNKINKRSLMPPQVTICDVHHKENFLIEEHLPSTSNKNNTFVASNKKT
jgi:hypothetical protein